MSIEHMTPAEFNRLPLQVKAAKDKAKKQKSETNTIVKPCLKWLKLHGIPAWRRNTGKTIYKGKDGKDRHVSFGLKGAGDIEGILPPHGRHLEVECKLPDKEQSADQKAFQAMTEKAGGIYILARSVDDLIPLLAI